VFARAVRELYDRDLHALGVAARARVLARFTWQRAMQIQQANYAMVASRSRVRVPDAVAEPEPVEQTP
jgi:hypothetical protein